MRSKLIVAPLSAMLIAAGVFAAVSIAGADKGEVQDARPKILKPVTAVANPDGSVDRAASAKRKSKKKPTIQYFYAPVVTVPPEGLGVVQALRCPKGKGEPIAAGAQTSVGIVISYLSRIKPGTGKTPARTYYVGVDDNSDTNAAGSGARVEIQCAKYIKVKRG